MRVSRVLSKFLNGSSRRASGIGSTHQTLQITPIQIPSPPPFRFLGLLVLCCSILISACRAVSTQRIPMRQENPATYSEDPSIKARQFAEYANLAITPSGNSDHHFNLTLSGKSGSLRLNDIDLLPFVLRVPAIARADCMLTEIAIEQDEYNRYDTNMPVPGEQDVTAHLANNCLNAGLWELYLTKRDRGSRADEKFYHGWFECPTELYARLFREENGLHYSAFSWLTKHFGRLDGLPVNLTALREVRTQRAIPVTTVQMHADQPVLRLAEQKSKLKLLLTKGLRTYGDFAARSHQPVTLTCFCPPGVYEYSRRKKFNYSFLSRIDGVIQRRVLEPALHSNYDEIEVDFASRTHWSLALSGGFPWLSWPFIRVTHGLKLVLGGIHLDDLPVITSDQTGDSKLRHVFFGIGTPLVYASYTARLAESEQQPSVYLLLLDRDDRYIDNHRTGIDGVYLGRCANGTIEMFIISYEREAIVAHWTLPPPSAFASMR